jgi:uncharacterized protein YbaP (TraB family)
MNKIRRLLLIITIILTLFLLSLSGCSSKKHDNATETSKSATHQLTLTGENKYGDVKGCIWEIKKGSATVYLFGSIHIAKKDMYPFNKTVEDAFLSSNNLVVEADVSDMSKVMKSQSKLIYAENDDIYKHLSKEGTEKLDAYSKELGMDMNNLKKMKLWVIESTLEQVQLQKSGYSSDDGVDMYFLNAAKDKKKILELESIDFQFDLLNSVPDSEQEKSFLADAKDLKEHDSEFNKIYEAYKLGDEKEMVKLIIQPSKQDSVYYKKMLVDRNIGMASKINGYLNTNNSYFVVAGLAHFIGDDSVIKLLEEKGYTVTRR